MRCKEAKQRMIENNGEPDKLLAEHIKSCQSCARSAQAMQILDHLMVAAKDEEEIPFFDETRHLVETRAANQTNLEKIMSYIKNQYYNYPKAIAGVGLAAIIFFFIILVPFSYDQTVGYKVIISNINTENEIPIEKLKSFLSSLSYDDVEIVQTSDGEYTITGIIAKSQAHNIAVTLSTFSGGRIEPVIVPIFESTSGSLYAQAVEKIKKKETPRLRLGVNKEGSITLNDLQVSNLLQDDALTDEQVYDSIINQLAEKGIGEEEIAISVDRAYDDNTRTLTLYPTDKEALLSRMKALELYAKEHEMYLRYRDSNDNIEATINDLFEFELPRKGDTLSAPILKIKMDMDVKDD